MTREEFVKVIENIRVGEVLLLSNRGSDNEHMFKVERIRYYNNPRLSNYNTIQFIEFEVTFSTGKIRHERLTVLQIVDNYNFIGKYKYKYIVKLKDGIKNENT